MRKKENVTKNRAHTPGRDITSLEAVFNQSSIIHVLKSFVGFSVGKNKTLSHPIPKRWEGRLRKRPAEIKLRQFFMFAFEEKLLLSERHSQKTSTAERKQREANNDLII